MDLRHYSSAVLAFSAFTVLLGIASPAQADFTAERCLADKVKAWGRLRQCQRIEETKAILGRHGDATKCARAFEDTLEKLDGKAGRAGIACRFLDNGDTTVTDVQTGLMWARLSGLDGVPSPYVLDADNVYTWTSAHAVASSLNGTSVGGAPPVPLPGFPRYSDWRLPTITELASVVDCAFVGMCFRPELGATRGGIYYWSSSADAESAAVAWRVSSTNGQLGVTSKGSTEAMRPVRTAF